MRKNTSFEKIGEPAHNYMVVISATTERPVSGLSLSDFTVRLKNPQGVSVYERTPAGGLITNSVPVTFVEVGTTGVYRLTFTPDNTGSWVLVVSHATHMSYGKRASYRVFDALYYVENQSELVEPFQVTDSAGNLVPDVPVSEFTAVLYNPSLELSSISVSITDVGNGDYEATYEADATGKWLLIVTHATYFPWGKYNDQRYTSNDVEDVDIVEAIRDLIVADTDMRARLSTYAFTTGTYTPAVFTTDIVPENAESPCVIIRRVGGIDWGTRGAEGEDTLVDVHLYGDRNRQTDVLRKTANVLRKLLNRARLTVTDGNRAFRCIADPPAAAPDPDGFPGYRITVRVLQLQV